MGKSRFKHVLFIGAFGNIEKNQIYGGQMYACRQLVNSELKKKIKWTLIDTYIPNNFSSVLLFKLFYVLKRNIKYIYLIFVTNFDSILIFTSSGSSLIEKFVMVNFSRIKKNKIILAPRSGKILNDFNSPFRKYLIRKIFEFSHVVICQSNEWKKTFSKYISLTDYKKYKVIHNWITLGDMRFKTEFFIPEIKILFIGSVIKEKGIFDLIEYALLLKENNIRFKITVAGSGKDFLNFSQAIDNLKLSNEFILLGWVDDTKKKIIMLEHDYFILPSYFEGTPNSLLEAMSFGLICFCTSVGSIPEIIINGQNGFLISFGVDKCILAILNNLETNLLLKSQISMNAVNTIHENFSIENAIAQFDLIL